MRYALNSVVIMSEGLFRYRHLSPEEAREWWDAGHVEARVGSHETCTALARVLGLGEAPELDRRTCGLEDAGTTTPPILQIHSTRG